MEFLRPAKNVPTTWWSADDPWTLKPRFSTMVLLIVGLIIFGAGDAVLISARLGNTPWTVLAEGIAKNLGWSIGESTFFVSFMVLLLWIPLREKPVKDASSIAYLQRHVLVFPELCKKAWCKVEINSYNGWVDRELVWGDF